MSGLSGPLVSDLAPSKDTDPGDPRGQRIVGGVINRGASSPTDTVRVVLPSFDAHHFYECRFWMPRMKQHAVAVGADGIDYPQAGDDALVAFTETGEAWLVAYARSS